MVLTHCIGGMRWISIIVVVLFLGKLNKQCSSSAAETPSATSRKNRNTTTSNKKQKTDEVQQEMARHNLIHPPLPPATSPYCNLQSAIGTFITHSNYLRQNLVTWLVKITALLPPLALSVIIHMGSSVQQGIKSARCRFPNSTTVVVHARQEKAAVQRNIGNFTGSWRDNIFTFLVNAKVV
eukprot:scaffold56209_cov65-Cyclotella_meneghiniana.AAC.5